MSQAEIRRIYCNKTDGRWYGERKNDRQNQNPIPKGSNVFCHEGKSNEEKWYCYALRNQVTVLNRESFHHALLAQRTAPICALQ